MSGISAIFKNMLSSPTKRDTPETSAASGDNEAAGPSSSPATESHPNRVQKSRKSATPVSARKDKQRAERLAKHVRTNSPLQEITNQKPNASRRRSAPAKPAATPRANNRRGGRLSTIPQVSSLARQKEEDEATPGSDTVFASQPPDVSMTSPGDDADTQPTNEGDEVVRDSQVKSSNEEQAGDAERQTPASQSVSEAARDLVQSDIGVDVYDIEGDTKMEDDKFTFTNILAHRWSGDEIEVKVDWHGDEATWEPEANLHHDAPDALFAYWRAQGGRPENPRDPGLYDIFAIRKHNRNKMRLLVEWTGYPPEDNTWESKKMLQETAPELLAEYWESVKPASKRGKKN